MFVTEYKGWVKFNVLHFTKDTEFGKREEINNLAEQLRLLSEQIFKSKMDATELYEVYFFFLSRVLRNKMEQKYFLIEIFQRG